MNISLSNRRLDCKPNKGEILRFSWNFAGNKSLSVVENGDSGLKWIDQYGEIFGNSYTRTVFEHQWVVLFSTRPENISQISWTVQQFKGNIDNIPLLRGITIIDFTSGVSISGRIPYLSNNLKLQQFNVSGCQLSGRIPDIAKNIALTLFNVSYNQLSGELIDISKNTALTIFNCASNRLTGSIPSLSTNTVLTSFDCELNQLTGSIPSLSTNTVLETFYCHINQLTGSIPSLSSNTVLTAFYCHTNQLTGSIPSLSSNTVLANFDCDTNQLTDFTGGVPFLLGSFNARNNLLSQTAVENILQAFITAGRTTDSGGCNLDLGGTGNSAPSFTGSIQTSTSMVGNGTIVTVTLVAHGYSTNDYLTITGAVNADFNGTYKITKINNDSFSFVKTSYTGTATVQGSLKKANITDGFYKMQRLVVEQNWTVTIN